MRRTVALALPALALALSLTACNDGGSTAATGTTPTPASNSAPPADAVSATPSATANDPTSTASNIQVVTLNVRGGTVTGDTGRARVQLGTMVDVAVTADVAEEVHIHGYDLMVDTVPGQTVHKQFVATIPGVFEIELEQSKTQLTRLQVQ